MSSSSVAVLFTCTLCGRDFNPTGGGHCGQCGKLFCHTHLLSTVDQRPGRSIGRCKACEEGSALSEGEQPEVIGPEKQFMAEQSPREHNVLSQLQVLPIWRRVIAGGGLGIGFVGGVLLKSLEGWGPTALGVALLGIGVAMCVIALGREEL